LVFQVISFDIDSFVYTLDYSTGTHILVQALSTSGANSVLLFNSLGGEAYLGIANYRSREGLSTPSRLYRWNSAANTSDLPQSCCDGQVQIGRFILVEELDAVAAISFEYWESEQESAAYIALISEGGTSLSLTAALVFKFTTEPSQPRSVILASSYLGPCDSLLTDALASFGSGGRPFEAKWTLNTFTPVGMVATTPRYGLAVKSLLNSGSLSSTRAVQVLINCI
jgi:hypothetical protein